MALLDRAGRAVLGHAVSYSRLWNVVCRLTGQAPIAPSPVIDDWRSVALWHYFFGVMSSAVGAVARWSSPFLAVAAVASMVCSADPVQVGPAPAVRLVDEVNPLAGAPFYVNPTSAAMRAAQNANPPSPELTAIANTPQAYWIVPGSSAATVAKYTGDAQAAGALPADGVAS